MKPDSAVKPGTTGSEAHSWSSEGVRLQSFKMILCLSHAVAMKLKHPLNLALVDAC